MLTATITIKYVNPPKNGKKRGTVKTDDDQYYGVFGDMIDQFQPGGVYEISFEESVVNGETYRNIKKANLAPASYGNAADQKTDFISGLPDSIAHPHNGNGHTKSNGTYKETSARDAERMWTCSLLNAAIQSGRVDIRNQEELYNTTVTLRSLWSHTFGTDDQPQRLRAVS